MNNSPSLVQSRSGARKNGEMLPLDRFNNTTVTESFDGSGLWRVRLHGNLIAEFNTYQNAIKLDTCGYYTPTTARRMNEALEAFNVPFRAHRSQGDYILRDVRDGKERPFTGQFIFIVSAPGKTVAPVLPW